MFLGRQNRTKPHKKKLYERQTRKTERQFTGIPAELKPEIWWAKTPFGIVFVCQKSRSNSHWFMVKSGLYEEKSYVQFPLRNPQVEITAILRPNELNRETRWALNCFFFIFLNCIN